MWRRYCCLTNFFYHASYASAVLGVVILSVRVSVRHTRALWLIQRTDRWYFYITQKGNHSSFLLPKISAKFQRGHPQWGRQRSVGSVKKAIFDQYLRCQLGSPASVINFWWSVAMLITSTVEICIQHLGRVEEMVFAAWCSYTCVVLGVVILSVSVCCMRALWLIQRTYRRYFYTTWKGNPRVKCDFSYSCAAADMISTDLTACAVFLQQLNYLFPIVDTCINCKDIALQSCAMVRRWQFFASFFHPVFPASCMQHISDMHSKFTVKPHRVWKYGRHPISDR